MLILLKHIFTEYVVPSFYKMQVVERQDTSLNASLKKYDVYLDFSNSYDLEKSRETVKNFREL